MRGHGSQLILLIWVILVIVFRLIVEDMQQTVRTAFVCLISKSVGHEMLFFMALTTEYVISASAVFVMHYSPILQNQGNCYTPTILGYNDFLMTNSVFEVQLASILPYTHPHTSYDVTQWPSCLKALAAFFCLCPRESLELSPATAHIGGPQSL